MPSLLMAENYCGEIHTGFGPFDYSNPEHRKNRLPSVERHHFSKQVDQLIEGITGPLGVDISFTLRAFPNHIGH